MAERTHVLERNLLSPLRKFFGERRHFASEQKRSQPTSGFAGKPEVPGRTLNMELRPEAIMNARKFGLLLRKT